MSTMMSDVYWALGGKHYPSYEAFVAAVSEHNQAIAAGTSGWDPERVVASEPEIRIVYEAMWKSEDDVLDVLVSARGEGGVTMGEVLYGLHEASVEFFANADHRFFEGLSRIDDTTWRLRTGS